MGEGGGGGGGDNAHFAYPRTATAYSASSCTLAASTAAANSGCRCRNSLVLAGVAGWCSLRRVLLGLGYQHLRQCGVSGVSSGAYEVVREHQLLL
jgi:hypothetical protein